ncbi:2-keto-myo-inositol dehydratase [Curtobacterium sp. 'Ferrero']|uniref:sugar phosphate isomerase/epimerase family protein n=1 Tax=Curtobacterium sp. 'Ferrero' TaxID=2033654 RepID=UPI000BD33BA2|nr:sugar phosphate isomerase/epimerase [Curtobacterium sp. 'Ferrero']PCN49747.1 2-keto-myo-inositol dehydratase [Curtobacterium sp. 'Ferrero']
MTDTVTDTVTDTDTARSIRIGTAPDSWGVWFADDPGQVPWQRFLDEASAAGYEWIELGPYGYLPTDPSQLSDELESRGLRLSAGTVFTGLHKGDDRFRRAWDQAVAVAGLVSQLGAEHLVTIPDLWRSDATGAVLEPRTLTDEQWTRLGRGHDQLGKALLEEFGVHQQFHTHADSHVGTYRETVRFLSETDPAYTNLCLDTGHFAYYGGDSLRMIAEHPERIGYLHLKQVDTDLLFDVLKNDVPFATAVAQGIMTEPPHGTPDLAPVIEAVAAIDPDVFGIVEQDMYGCAVDVPAPIAERTVQHILRSTPAARVS